MNLGFRVSNHNSQIRVCDLGGFQRVEGGEELSVVMEESVEGRDKGCVNAMVQCKGSGAKCECIHQFADDVTEVLALTVVSIGVAVATVTDLQFHLLGACIALAWIIPSAVNKIMWSNMQQRENWTALAYVPRFFTLFCDLSIQLYMFPKVNVENNTNYCIFFGGDDALARSHRRLVLQLEFQEHIYDFYWSGALALGATSAITHVVLGQFKTCVIVLGGYILFGSNPGLTSLCGAITALLGMSIYTYLNLHASNHHSNKTSRQASSSLPKSKLSRENSESHDGNVATESV
ncbi:hypothetical protein Cgig2_027348 [Carnegiea gigantea]|uniref:Uncharacterized protein n=1 Tax=Carnegiea gigantea TaxID=171969 RepID=A0A9Q1JEH4_9CARY|nr:hypothetical protein Cgig2_027348 [Carnegiea gigantea]